MWSIGCLRKSRNSEELISPSLTIGIVKRLINFSFLVSILKSSIHRVFNYINCALLFHTSIALWNGTPINIICSNVYNFYGFLNWNLCLNCVIILYCCGKCGYLFRSLPKKIIFIDMKYFSNKQNSLGWNKQIKFIRW